MARHTTIPFQLDQPLFVKVPFRAGGKSWTQSVEFPWKEMSMNQDKIMTLYNNGFLYHDPEKEASDARIGDGLEALDIEALHVLVATINEKVAAKVENKTQFKRFKCKQLAYKDKQIAAIRQWRRTYGQYEED